MWGVDWAWGVPLLLGAVAFQVVGLVLIEAILRWSQSRRVKPRSLTNFLLAVLFTANALLFLHVLEGMAWAWLYLQLEAVDDFPKALLISLNALTSYGHDGGRLEEKWQLLGAIESMNGVMIFGLSTAFLFNAMTQMRAR